MKINHLSAEPHKTYCKNCPSKYGPSDPEADDIASWPEDERVMHVFPCAWRPNKLCRGVCEKLGYSSTKHGPRLLAQRQKDLERFKNLTPSEPR